MSAEDTNEIAALRARVADLEATVAQLDRSADGHRDRGSSRRLLLRSAALTVGSAVVGAAVLDGRAAATDGFPLELGLIANLSTSPTEARNNGVTTTGTPFLFQAGVNAEPLTVANAALVGAATNGTTQSGVAGRSDKLTNGIGVYGEATSTDKSTGVSGLGETGVKGRTNLPSGVGVSGVSNSGPGVIGSTTSGQGVWAQADSGVALLAESTSGRAIQAVASTAGGTFAVAAVHATGGIGVLAVGTDSGVMATGAAAVRASGTILGVDANGGAMGLSAIGRDTGVYASGASGVVAAGTYAFVVNGADRAAIKLSATGFKTEGPRQAPSGRTDAHVAGEVDIDANHDLWLCTAAGTPGTWRKLAGPSTAGAFHPVTPSRVYDSRAAAPGPVARLVAGSNRLVNVAARRAIDTGAGVEHDFVPAGATAIAANVTVVDTLAAGFLAINPGGNTTVGAAAVNWFASGQILNNGVTLTLNANRELTVIAGGDTGAAAHFVIDVTGYYL